MPTCLSLDCLFEAESPHKIMLSVSREFANGVSLSAPGFTPWFDTWVKLYINSVPTVEHEFVRHHLGCVYAVSASNDNPITALRNLSEHHYRHQVRPLLCVVLYKFKFS